MLTDEDRLRRIEDKDEIRELTARYCYAVADNDVSAIVDLFCPDCTFEVGEREYEGAAGLRKLYGDPMPEPTPKPFIQNHVIDVNGDRASGRCGAEIRMVQDGEAYTVAGYYEDEYRRIDGRWKFASRRFKAFHWVPLSKGWA